MNDHIEQAKDPKAFWRSLEELADSESFVQHLQQEFPHLLAAGTFRSNRRQFLKLMGAMLAMSGLTGCTTRAPNEQILPYVNAPEEIIQGKPLFFATAMPRDGYALGVLVENHMGRPTKVEGNPQHPASLGATDPIAQASVLSLYDPDRAQVVSNRGGISTWNAFLEALNGRLEEVRANNGAGLYILSETVTSPTLGAQMAALRQQFPELSWRQYQPVNRDNVHVGAQLTFGSAVHPVYHFDQAARILSLDANFLYALPGSVRYAHDFIERRRVWSMAGADEMSRLYVVESAPTITGAKADHRWPLRPSQIPAVAHSIAAALGVTGAVDAAANLPPGSANWIASVAADLQAHRGTSLIMVGDEQPPEVHILGHLINAALENVGRTVTYTAPVEVEPVLQSESLRSLAEDIDDGRVHTLLILHGNPAYSAPADLQFAERLANVPFSVHSSLYFDETSARCHWHIPAAHYLEAWGDIRAYDGAASIIQPLIAPLFDGKTAHELLATLLGQPEQSAYDIVKGFWTDYYEGLADPPQGDAESFWRTALHDGVVAGTTFPTLAATASANVDIPGLQEPATGTLEIIFRPDPAIWDGQYANNAWLQELPRHLTQITWDNAALVSPATAARLNLASQDQIELMSQGRSVTAPVWVTPGHPDEAVTLYLGYGRTQAGEVATGVGANAYALRNMAAPWGGPGAEIRKLNTQQLLATTQEHYALEGRDLVRMATLAQYQENPGFAQMGVDHATGTGPGNDEAELHAPSLYPEFEYDGNAWGMAIDLTACIGCNACVIACQVENNVPVVGKEGVLRSREMHWLKIDRYYQGEPENPETFFQPRLCMHCEKAPCEPVCPVEATLHDAEGLNQMVYNRCVGTRYCSNNCPYKVRRYNFFDYNEDVIPLTAMWRNPDVTVRSRGVMEKCTYCVQRINQARIEGKKENRPLQDGEIRTACQEACPTRAIVFGDINDAQSVVAQMKEQPLNYGMLADLGTQPRTTYLAEVRNPNPEIG